MNGLSLQNFSLFFPILYSVAEDLWLSWLTICFRLGYWRLALLGGVREWWFSRRAGLAVGVVAALREVNDGDGGTGFSAVVRYEAQGQAWEVVDRMVNRPASHTVGQRVRVYYPLSEPNQGRLHHAWVLPFCLVIGGLGLVWLLLALAGIARP